MTPPERVLGIETSCDETAAAVVEGGTRVLASVVHGQEALHAPYGGVVPELASRDHLGALDRIVAAALAEAGLTLRELSGVAVTAGPGLLGSLLVGLCFAKALAYRAGLPCVGVHHLAGHLAAAELADASLRAPYLGLVVSGGHTALYRIEGDAPSRAPRRDPRRRRRRGLRQGGEAARPARSRAGPPSRVSPSRATRARSRFRGRSRTRPASTSPTAG